MNLMQFLGNARFCDFYSEQKTAAKYEPFREA